MYGSAHARALYGRGDYQTRAAFSPGYYQAGGFFSKLKAVAAKGNKLLNKTVVGKALQVAVPGLGQAGALLGGASKLGLIGSGGAKQQLIQHQLAAAPAKRRKPRRSSRRKYYAAGDWGDDGGRDKRGHFLNARGGHHHRRKKHPARRTKAYFRALRAKYGRRSRRRR